MSETVRGLVVVGSGPAGLAAVRSFREHDPASPVIMITEDPYPPYARPPLTKDFLRGTSDLADLWLTDAGWFEKQGSSWSAAPGWLIWTSAGGW